MQRNPHNKQRGVALIMALLIVALAASLATLMILRLTRDTARTATMIDMAKAEGYAEGGLIWAEDQLQANWRHRQNNMIAIDAPFIVSPVTHEAGYDITVTIASLQNRYNLNELKTVQAELSFQHLLNGVLPQLSQEAVAHLTHDIAAGVKQQHGLQRGEELRFVKGVSAQAANALLPFVVALPAVVPVDVQAPLAPVLMALSPTLTLDEAERIVAACKENPPNTVDAFFAMPSVKSFPFPRDRVTVISQFFWVTVSVSQGAFHTVLHSAIQRKIQGETVSFEVLWQQAG
jgi:general secretion pathway protein K